MSTRRLVVATLGMDVSGLLLGCLAPDASTLLQAFARPQHVADATGADAVVLAWAAALAWAVWGWGVVGLVLTAATAVPGLLGRAARTLLRGVLPAGARRAAAVALGIGLGVGIGAPVLATAAPLAAVPASVPDWPATPEATPAPDWPSTPPGEHVVVRGDCLWHIAAAWLTTATGRTPTDGEIADAVRAWWTANTSVIGPDPDRLLPGQVLRPPPAA